MNPKVFDDLKSRLAELRREGEERQAQRLAQKLGYKYVDLSKTPVSIEAIKIIPEAEAREAKLAAIELKARHVAIAAANPETPAAKKILRELTDKKYELKVFVVSLSGLLKAWEFYKFIKPEAAEITGKVVLEEKKIAELKDRLINFAAIQKEIEKTDFSKASPAHLLEIILGGALALRASDIHLETEEKSSRFRLRVDGVLHDVFSGLDKEVYELLLSRLKLLSGLKINVRDEAQDGRFTIGLGGKEIEVRVSVIPEEFGEAVVMRVLDPEVTAIELHDLGIREDDLAILKKEIARPNGLILNTGPTGSGKTTTLYGILRQINSPEVKIITLEDPIEYRLEGIEQTQVDEESGYTFANGLRAIVRQDPDVILVGEIRDKDTADIALQAALTGHLVLSTLHTNNAIGAVPRLVNLGVQAVSIGPALNLVIAQRLVRRLCPHCKKEVKVSPIQKNQIAKFLERLPERVDRTPYRDFKIFEPVGCSKCGDIGYKGRFGIFEFLTGGLDLEEIILKDASEVALTRLSNKQGMVTMQEDGVLKVLQGITTFEEVEGATGEIDWE